MLYIHQSSCISPQHTFVSPELTDVVTPVNQMLKVIEPEYEEIPPGILRRMGKAVRIGVGAALPLLRHSLPVNGIILGTANGGMEDCIRFLNQIIQYEEGQLTPGNFVQSTPNAIAAMLGMMDKNKGYNITHVHRGHSFEIAALDAMMMSDEFPSNRFILGAVDEISDYNYNIEQLGGWYKNDPVDGKFSYDDNSPGSLAGEGSAMFLVSGKPENAQAKIVSIQILKGSETDQVTNTLNTIKSKYSIDLLLTGENGDNRFQEFYNVAEKIIGVPVARFKHLSGEYPTSTSFATWLALWILRTQQFPEHLRKHEQQSKEIKNILIYSHYKGVQHSFILLQGL